MDDAQVCTSCCTLLANSREACDHGSLKSNLMLQFFLENLSILHSFKNHLSDYVKLSDTFCSMRETEPSPDIEEKRQQEQQPCQDVSSANNP